MLLAPTRQTNIKMIVLYVPNWQGTAEHTQGPVRYGLLPVRILRSNINHQIGCKCVLLAIGDDKKFIHARA